MRRRSTFSFESALRPTCIAVLIMSSGISAAQDDSVRLAPIVVTPTRVEQSSFDLPVSIDAFNKEQIQQGQAQVNLSETLIRAPGIVANTRQNYAQDLQVSLDALVRAAQFRHGPF